MFSFWQPLDRKFITYVARMAARENVELKSLFWSRLLFAYLDHMPALDRAPYGEVTRIPNEAVFRAMTGGALTPTGAWVRQLATGGP